MARRRVKTSLEPPDHCFAKELAGEALPSFSSLRALYDLATELFRLRPWEILGESELILVRAGAGGEMCYCSVMGAAGGVYFMHADICTAGFCLFHGSPAGEDAGPSAVISRAHHACLRV